jgi:hypothetical protein
LLGVAEAAANMVVVVEPEDTELHGIMKLLAEVQLLNLHLELYQVLNIQLQLVLAVQLQPVAMAVTQELVQEQILRLVQLYLLVVVVEEVLEQLQIPTQQIKMVNQVVLVVAAVQQN